jgi:hypothetical protein
VALSSNPSIAKTNKQINKKTKQKFTKPTEFVARKPVEQEILKGILQAETEKH